MMNPTAPAAAPEAAAPSPEMEGSTGKPGEQLLLMNDALTGLAATFGEDKATPPEAVTALEDAAASYQKFLSILGESKGIPTPKVEGAKGGAQPADSMGSKNAVPADMPMSRGRAVPAM